MSSSSPDTSPAGVVAAEAVLQNPATLRELFGPVLCLVLGRPAWRHPRRAGPGHRARMAGLCGLSTLVFALSRSMVLSAAALAVLGAADMVSVFVRQTLVQIVTPDSMRGRVSAVSSLFIGASNELGEFESGGMARLLGPVGSAIFGGCGAILVTLLWAGLFPALRRADRLE